MVLIQPDHEVEPLTVYECGWHIRFLKAGECGSAKKPCILLFGQQGAPTMVAKKTENDWLSTMERSTKFIHKQTGLKSFFFLVGHENHE